ncbi:MAG: cyclic nucleotide-binding domain-containing protein [Acidimicrobiia bacterium]|nr:cyclic nucleotide-binding domain-containing protein [Acidimicrobiia bacterium]
MADVPRGSVTLARLEPGGYFEEMSLLDDGPRTATVTTSGPATLLATDRATFRAVLLSCPDVALSLLTTLSHWVRHAES